jgi:hypothetical protein
MQGRLDLPRQPLSVAICRLQLTPLGAVGAIKVLQGHLRELPLHALLATAGNRECRFVRQHLLKRRPKLGFFPHLRLRIYRRLLTLLLKCRDTPDQIGLFGALSVKIGAQPMNLASPDLPLPLGLIIRMLRLVLRFRLRLVWLGLDLVAVGVDGAKVEIVVSGRGAVIRWREVAFFRHFRYSRR